MLKDSNAVIKKYSAKKVTIAFMSKIIESSSNPYDSSENIDTNFIDDISELDIKFMYERSWYDKWPVSPVTERQIPTLIKLEFKKNSNEYIWIIEPNIDYVFKR